MIQVYDGDGEDRFKIDQAMAKLARLARSTSHGDDIRDVLLELVDLKVATFNASDDVVVIEGTTSMTFPSSLIGPPSLPWIMLAEEKPPFNGYYWILITGHKKPIIAEYSGKGWRLPEQHHSMSINSQHIKMWKKCWSSEAK